MSADARTAPERRGLYARLLGLRAVHLNAWQRALLAEGTLAVAVLLVLADLASAWALVVLPAVVAALVKAHDLVAGLLQSPNAPTAPVQEDRRRRGGTTG